MSSINEAVTHSVNQPSRLSTHVPHPARALLLPNLCATTSVFFLVLVSELLVLVWVLLQPTTDWVQLGYTSLLVQWVVLPSAALLCRMRAWLARRPLWQGWLTAFLSVSMIGLTVSLVGDWMVRGTWAGIDAWRVLRQTLATAIIAALLLRYFQLQQEVVDRSRAELAARIEALQNRIRPHFLFNSLNTIAELIATRPAEAEQAIEDLSRLFRASLKEAGTFWSLEEELALVQGYLSLEQWRLGDRLRVVWRTPPPTLRWSVPVLILQPLIENAIVHGIAPRIKGGSLVIGCYHRGDRLMIDIENPLPEKAAQEAPSGGNRIALNNIRHRLATLYDGGAKLYTAREDRAFRVRLTLPARLVNQARTAGES